MAIALPDLDDRRWLDLVDEARALIPVYAPEWTDHNAHDPGITLVELLAYLTDGTLYRVNQISDRHRLLMLALAGVRPRPVRPARTVMTFRAAGGKGPVALPATTELASGSVMFRTRRRLIVTEATLAGLWTRSGGELAPLGPARARGDALALFGSRPAVDSELLLGFAGPLPPGRRVSLVFEIGDGDDRCPLVRELRDAAIACRTPYPCGRPSGQGLRRSRTSRLHHDAVTAWEYRTSSGAWEALEVHDATRAFTLSGAVTIRIPVDPVARPFGDSVEPLFMIRARLASGALDTPASARRVWFNAVEAEQAVPVSQTLSIAADADIEGVPPPPGGRSRVLWRLAGRQITFLRFGHDAGPALSILQFTAPSAGAAGQLTLGAVLVGVGTGGPNQEIALDSAPVTRHGFELWSFEDEERWERWTPRDDLIASGRAARDVRLDEMPGTLRFGDGRRGRVPPRGAVLIASFSSSLGAAGDTPASAVTIVDSVRNRALLGDLDAIRQSLDALEHTGAKGGADRESVAETAARAALGRDAVARAVTLDDIEALVSTMPGGRIGRVRAVANTSPGLPAFDAPGVVTVVFAPAMPVPRPTPSRGLRRAVARYLARRRILGTRFEIVGPEYRTIAVRARVRPLPGHAAPAVAERVRRALDTFLDPLRGGADGRGWPFGRDVYRSEVMDRIDRVAGVDHVLALELIADGGPPQCGNICVSPFTLTTPGDHQIEAGT